LDSYVQAPQTEAELKRLRQSVNRGTPFGSHAWVLDTAKRLGLISSPWSGSGPMHWVAGTGWA
jgi:hypothetical protein